MSTLAAVIHKPGVLRVEQRNLREPGDDEVLLHMHSVGVCGSDVHVWAHGNLGDDYILDEPISSGHEGSGVVKKCGKNVKHLKPGDRVAIEPGVSCGKCINCKSGLYNICPEQKFLGLPPTNGDMVEYHVHPAEYCFKLPDNVTLEEGALVEPLSVGIYALSRCGGVNYGDKVLICGSGTIGLVTIMAAKAMGAGAVCVTDTNADRLQLAKEIGADHVLVVGGSTSTDKSATKVEEIMGGKPDVTIECCGFEAATKLAILATKPGGSVVLVGLGSNEYEIPSAILATRQITLYGAIKYVNCYPKAIEMISSGKAHVRRLISHRYPLKDALAAFETAKKGTGVKVLVHCGAPEN